jgi:hypothetical protein
MNAQVPSDQQRLEAFVNALVDSLKSRYEQCEDFAATPSSILLAVLNAVADARQAADI